MLKTDRSVGYINLIFLKGERNKFPVVFSLLKTSEERNAWQLAAVRSVVCTAEESCGGGEWCTVTCHEY